MERIGAEETVPTDHSAEFRPPSKPRRSKPVIGRDRQTAGMSIVQHRPETTRYGGVTGKGFTPGVSGNPGGRPKGLSRRVRELVGEDGGAIAEYMLSVMEDDRARTADRIDAGKWLADRGFGKSPLVVSAGVTAEELLQDYFRKLSLEDLEAMRAILKKYSPEVAELGNSGAPALEA
jgi:hypothetical protein